MLLSSGMVILGILACEHRWWYVSEIIEKSNNELSKTTIFLHLQMLEEHQHVESRMETNEEKRVPENWLGRKLYKITEAGRRHLAEKTVDDPDWSLQPA